MGTARRVTGAFASLAVLLALGAGLAACSPLRTFDALVPKDEAGLVTRNVAYGPDPRQRVDIYAPPRSDAASPFPAGSLSRAPVVVFIHGGSWRTGTKDGYRWVGRALAARGFVAVLPNYRLVPDGRYPAMAEDAAAAIMWTAENAGAYGGDGGRLAVAGHSAGAYNAAQAVLAPEFGVTPDTVDALVVLSGPADFLPLDTASTIAAFGHVDADGLPRTQPVLRVDERPAGSVPPTLIVHGTADDTVAPRHAIALDAAIRTAGGRSELRLYDGVDHRGVVLGLSRPFRARVPTLDDMTDFLAPLLGRPE